jgi:hypothetical protein
MITNRPMGLNMLRNLVIVFTLAAAALAAAPAHGQQLVETYVARLSERDHFNSNGQRLTSAAAIIRQDRANYFRFGRGDAEDQPDRFFADVNNRATLERMLARGRASPGALAAIVNGTPVVRVDIYRDTGGYYVHVEVLN